MRIQINFTAAFLLLVGGSSLSNATQADTEADLSIVARGEIASSGAPQGVFGYHSGMTGLFQAAVVRAQQQPIIRLRYKIWTLVGEPVVVFTGQAAPFSRITLRDDQGGTLLEIAENSSLPRGTVRANDAGHVTVSSDLMALARIYDFTFHADVRQDALNRLPVAARQGQSKGNARFDSVSIYRTYRGILGKGGEWGWDVPGSPNWGDLYYHRNMPPRSFTRDWSQGQSVGSEAAKEITRRLLYAHKVEDVSPLVNLRVGEFKVHIHDLIHAIWQQKPEALNAVLGIRSDVDRELGRILMGFSADLSRHGMTDVLQQEAKKIDQFFKRQEFSGRLLQTWKHIRDDVAAAAADRRAAAVLQDIAPRAARALERGDAELNRSLTGEIDQARDYFDSDPGVSETMSLTARSFLALLEPKAEMDGSLIGGRFRNNGDCTFTDVATNLQWTGFFAGQGCGSNGKVYGNADSYNLRRDNKRSGKPEFYLDYAGHDDWRRPEISELLPMFFCPNSEKTHASISMSTTGTVIGTFVRVASCPSFQEEVQAPFHEQFFGNDYGTVTIDEPGGNSEMAKYFDSVRVVSKDGTRWDWRSGGCLTVWLPDLVMSLPDHPSCDYDLDEHVIWVRDDNE